MKTNSVSSPLRWLTAFGVAAVLTVGAFAALTSTSPAPSSLQLVVAVPPTARPLLADDAADALSGAIQENLTRRGYTGMINYPGNEQAAPVLTVKLVEWRRDPLGSMKCTFTASVRTEAGTKELGLFSGSSLVAWNGGNSTVGANIENHSEAMQEAANDAIGSMTKSLAKSGLLPGFAKLKK